MHDISASEIAACNNVLSVSSDLLGISFRICCTSWQRCMFTSVLPVVCIASQCVTHMTMYVCNTKTGEHVQICLPPELACVMLNASGQDALCMLSCCTVLCMLTYVFTLEVPNQRTMLCCARDEEHSSHVGSQDMAMLNMTDAHCMTQVTYQT